MQTKNFKKILEEYFLIGVTSLLTTAITNNHESMKYRGVFKKDKQLGSVPLCLETDDGLKVLSGNHRIQTCKEANNQVDDIGRAGFAKQEVV
jgi:hypothetical protein